IEIAIRLGERGSFGSDIAVVEAIERRAELLHELEGDAHAAKRVVDGVLRRFPGSEHRARAEGIAPCASKRMPVRDGEAEVLLHRLAFDHFALVVVTEGERVIGFGTLVTDGSDLGESLCHVLRFTLEKSTSGRDGERRHRAMT